jgi:hypothetical protein
MSNAYQTTLSDAARIIIQHEEQRIGIARLAASLGLPVDLPPWLVISCARDLATSLRIYQPKEFARIVDATAALRPPEVPHD